MSLIEVKQLTKNFGSLQALKGISFAVEAGEIFGYLGPNGAGKSTTIRVLMDFIRPNSGSAHILGHPTTGAPASMRADIGYVPAEPNLYGHLTVRDHLQLVASLRGINLEHARSLADSLELDLGRRVRQLSTGNQQKVAIVLGLMSRPKLLILDEPTRGLDPILQSTFHRLLREYQAAGGTVFLSSHNLSEVEELCTRIAVIRDGRLIADTEIQQLKARRAHQFNVTFKGHVPHFTEAGIQDLQVTDHSMHFTYTGDVNLILRSLSQHSVTSLEITQPGLEQIFMEMYQS